MNSPRPSIGRWLIAVPLGLVGLFFITVAVREIALLVSMWINPDYLDYLSYFDSPWLAQTERIAGPFLIGLVLITHAWLLVRRREGRDG